MKRIPCDRVIRGLIAVGWLAAGSVRALDTNSAATVAELDAQIEAHISEPRFSSALWGVKIVSLDSGKVIFAHHADRLMSPASNSKLYAAALALDRLGADYKISTPILATARPDTDGTVRGDLIISGRGDPSWNARHAGTNFWDLFSPFVAALTNAGVRHVTGDLIGDTTFFRSPPTGGSWTVDDLENSEGAEISALTLADNFTQIRVTPATRAGVVMAVRKHTRSGLSLSDMALGGAFDMARCGHRRCDLRRRIQALVERGVTWDRSDGRAGMEAAALAWNEARKGRVRSEQSAPAMRPVVNTDSPEFQAAVMEAVRAALAEHSQAPQSQQPVIDLEKAYPGQTAPQIIIDDPRVGDGPRTAEVATLDTVDATLIPSMDMASLKALLKASDVVFNEKALPHTLRKIALDEVEQRQRAA